MLWLFLITGFCCNIRSGFFQIRKWNYWWRETVGSLGRVQDGQIRKDEKKKQGKKRAQYDRNVQGRRQEHIADEGTKSTQPASLTQFQSVCTALAATIGTGNIVGVATALTAGGPGAIFWMWVSALIGMMSAYTEACLGIIYRYRNKQGSWVGGPMVYMERGLGWRRAGLWYGIFCVMAAFGMGSMVQSNSMTETLKYSFTISPALAGAAIVLLVTLVIGGGIGRIAGVVQMLVPWSAGIYIVFSVSVVILYWQQIPQVILGIVKSAWCPDSIWGGVAGYGISRSLQYGISRGVFTNEAGLGTLSILHCSNQETSPEKQGMWAMFEVFFDTIVICTLTALVILCTTAYDTGRGGAAGLAGSQMAFRNLDGAALTSWSFTQGLGTWGGYVVSVSMLLFAFATIIAWYHMGKQAVTYVSERLGILLEVGYRVYFVLYLAAVAAGCFFSLEMVWELSDIWNGGMAAINLTALLWLSKRVKY